MLEVERLPWDPGPTVSFIYPVLSYSWLTDLSADESACPDYCNIAGGDSVSPSAGGSLLRPSRQPPPGPTRLSELPVQLRC